MFDLIWGRGGANQRVTRKSAAYLFNGLQVLGSNPTLKWKRLNFLYTSWVYLCVNFNLPVALLLSYYRNAGQMSTSQLLSSLQLAFNCLGLPPKLWALKTNMRRLREETELIMDALDGRCRLQQEFCKIRTCVMFGNRITLFYGSVYVLSILSALVSSLNVGQPPYSIYLPLIDWRNSKFEFAIQTLVEVLMMTLASSSSSMTDVFPLVYIYILRTHIQILVKRVRNLGRDECKNKDLNYQELVDCVKDHQHLLRFLELISPIISITLFVQFTITAAILCTTMINILIFADTAAQIASVVYFLGVMIQITPCCYQATCLLDDNELLSQAIVQCNWMDEDKRFRKMLIFFMQRSQRPMGFMALKLFPITLDTSISIAKFSFSLYTLIQNFYVGYNPDT